MSVLLVLGVMVGLSAHAAEGLSRQGADLPHMARQRVAAFSHNQPGGEAGGGSWDLTRNEPDLHSTPAGTGSEVGHAVEIPTATSPGQAVAAPVSGRVVFAAPFKSYGPLLIVQDGEYYTVLWGFARLEVAVEDLVVKGQTIGLIGDEGGPLSILHVESRRDGRVVLHQQFLKRRPPMQRLRQICASDSAAFAFCAGRHLGRRASG